MFFFQAIKCDSGKGETSRSNVLRVRDLIVFIIFTGLFLTSISSMEHRGFAALYYWFLGSLFLISFVYVTLWFARRLPGPTGHYHWMIQLAGKRWGTFLGLCIWLCSTLITLPTLRCVVNLIHVIHPTWLYLPIHQYLAEIALLIFSTGLALLSLQQMKRMLYIAIIPFMLLLLVVGLVEMWGGIHGHLSQVLLSERDIRNLGENSFDICMAVMWSLVGVTWPFILMNEMAETAITKAQVYHAIWWGCICILTIYALAALVIFKFSPPSGVNLISWALVLVMRTLGKLPTLVLLGGLFVSYMFIIAMILRTTSRLLVALAQSKMLPEELTRLHGTGVPRVSIYTQMMCVGITMLVIYTLVPNTSSTGYQVSVFMQVVAEVLWMLVTALLLAQAAKALLQKKACVMQLLKQKGPIKRQEYWHIEGLSLLGISVAITGICLTLVKSRIPESMSEIHWVGTSIFFTLMFLLLGWLSLEIPLRWAIFTPLKHMLQRENALRQELQTSYAKQEGLIQEQQTLLGELRRLYQEQAQIAHTDAITGLPNHRSLMTYIDTLILDKKGETLALLFIDLDHFKGINDTYGHLAGDFVLHEVGQRLQQVVKQRGMVGRYGGEEFAVLLAKVDNSTVRVIAEKLREAIQQAPCVWVRNDDHIEVPINMTISIGGALYPTHATKREKLFEVADTAMYQAKNSGRNRFEMAPI